MPLPGEQQSREQGPGLPGCRVQPPIQPPWDHWVPATPISGPQLQRSPACLTTFRKGDSTLSRAGWLSWEQGVSLGRQHSSPSHNIHLLLFLPLPIFLTMASHAPKTSEVCCASQAKLSFEGEHEQRECCRWRAGHEVLNKVP